MASSTGAKELELSKQEADIFAKAINDVQSFYPVAMSAKAQAWLSLIMVAGTIYGPRATMLRARIIKERAEKPTNTRQEAPKDVNPRPTGGTNASSQPRRAAPLTPSQLYGTDFRG